MPIAEVFIPARAASRRFPNKPLAQVRGKTVLARTLAIARAALPEALVTVLTDSEDIAAYARSLHAAARIIDDDCNNGTERMARALLQQPSAADVVINLQGDALLVPPTVVACAAEAAFVEQECPVVTPIVPLDAAAFDDYCQKKAAGRASGTLALSRLDDTALWFTKGIAPAWRETPQDGVWAWRHVGLYAMRPKAALAYLDMAPTPLERAESLEQLRWLEHGCSVRLVRGDLAGRTLWSIDHPQDVTVAEDIIAREGELICA